MTYEMPTAEIAEALAHMSRLVALAEQGLSPDKTISDAAIKELFAEQARGVESLVRLIPFVDDLIKKKAEMTMEDVAAIDMFSCKFISSRSFIDNALDCIDARSVIELNNLINDPYKETDTFESN